MLRSLKSKANSAGISPAAEPEVMVCASTSDVSTDGHYVNISIDSLIFS